MQDFISGRQITMDAAIAGSVRFAADAQKQKVAESFRSGRVIQICHELERMKAKVRENMSSDEGHEIMVSRSIQAEGTFGDLKENYRYSRLRRRGLENVKFEVLIVAMGHNIRKLVSRSIQAEGTFGDLKENYRYSRLRRRGLENVKFEVLIVAMGHNIRKLNNRNRMSCSELERYRKLNNRNRMSCSELERYGKLKEQKSEI